MPELIYEGQGKAKWKGEPVLYRRQAHQFDDAAGYFADRNLADAVNAAIFLRQPLLVTGEPGTGKTELANSIAWEFDLPLHVFHTKTSSTGSDIFYRYDALLHFHDTNVAKREPDLRRYVRFGAMGKAILFGMNPEKADPYLSTDLRLERKKQSPSVVLIDEVDKAPRDFPNDILYEIERLSFQVRETDWFPFAADDEYRPIVVLTSNLERSLPDAFLRRCVFYYIPFPGPETLKRIVENRLKPNNDGEKSLYAAGQDAFVELRADDKLMKKPATAEMLSWLKILSQRGFSAAEVKLSDARLRSTLNIVLKTKEDLERFGVTQKAV